MLQAFSNIDEELEKFKRLQESLTEINKVEIDKLFIDKKKLAELLHCSETAAGRLMNRPDFPLIRIGKTPLVNAVALAEYTRQRIDLSE